MGSGDAPHQLHPEQRLRRLRRQRRERGDRSKRDEAEAVAAVRAAARRGLAVRQRLRRVPLLGLGGGHGGRRRRGAAPRAAGLLRPPRGGQLPLLPGLRHGRPARRAVPAVAAGAERVAVHAHRPGEALGSRAGRGEAAVLLQGARGAARARGLRRGRPGEEPGPRLRAAAAARARRAGRPGRPRGGGRRGAVRQLQCLRGAGPRLARLPPAHGAPRGALGAQPPEGGGPAGRPGLLRGQGRHQRGAAGAPGEGVARRHGDTARGARQAGRVCQRAAPALREGRQQLDLRPHRGRRGPAVPVQFRGAGD
mmetsp:Transcript_97155/g.253132  ORF Transcript_97155/g.253132 Transcript_97155/m.253132 type:complete len:309 (+) Transcript_97155:1137-2063(+)